MVRCAGTRIAASAAAVMLAAAGCGVLAAPPSATPSTTATQRASVPPAAPAASRSLAPTPSADPPEAAIPAGARITGRVEVPNSGALTVDDGAVWVIDRGLPGDTNGGTKVTGRLIRVDPASLATSVVARKVIGAQVAVEAGSAWIASAFEDRLLRIDVATGRVTPLETGVLTPELAAAERAHDNDRPDMFPYAVVAADGNVWVANHDAGTVARFDATTGRRVATIPVVDPGGSGLANLATDGARVWATAARSSTVFEIDAASNAVTATYDVAPGWACGGSTFDGTDVWVTSGHDQADPCHEDGAWGLSRVDPATGVVTHVDVGGRPMDVAAGLGGVWVVTDKPHPALVRLDPATLRVVGRLALGAVPNVTNPMAIGEGAIWIRVVDFWQDGMSPWPGMDRVSPSVLRIEPLG